MQEFKYKQFTIMQQHAAMKVGTDSDLLGTLAEGGRSILDVGTGTGVLSLMLAQRYPEARITAIEIDDDAVLDARANFEASPFSDRIELHHTSFQDYVKSPLASCGLSSDERLEHVVELFDSVVCNPPYFDKSTECPTIGRTRARHSSSLPFSVLAEGAYALLMDGGVFSVCIPPEVLSVFKMECTFAGFFLKDVYAIQSLPDKPAKRYVLVHQKGRACVPITHTHCMRNADHTRSDWYRHLMQDFLVTSN